MRNVDRPKLSGVLIVNGELLGHPLEVFTREGCVFVIDAEKGEWQVYPPQPAKLPHSRDELYAESSRMGMWNTVQRIRDELTGLPFDEAARRMMEILQAKFPTLQVRQSQFYGDVLVHTGKGSGIVALLNEDARSAKRFRRKPREPWVPDPPDPPDPPGPPGPPDPDVERFANRLTEALVDGWTVVVEGEVIVVIPFPLEDLVRSIRWLFEHWRWSSPRLLYRMWPSPRLLYRMWPISLYGVLRVLIRVAMSSAYDVFPDRWRFVPPTLNAVIFYPHQEWQRQVAGCSSSYPLEMAFDLAELGLSVAIYLNGAVSVLAWSEWLGRDKFVDFIDRRGRWVHRPLRLIYNQGHGDIDVIYCRDGSVDEFFTSDYVRQVASLDAAVFGQRTIDGSPVFQENGTSRGNLKPLVYIHSCLTANQASDMPQAFIDCGAATYVGWRQPTTADPWYCDNIDRRFWLPLTVGAQFVRVAESGALEFEAETGYEYRNFRVVGSRSWRLSRQLLAEVPIIGPVATPVASANP